MLLVGPPGTGKTLLAKAVSGEAGVPFFTISGSDFVEMFVGVGASRVRDLFAQAKKAAPSIIFIDEIDAVGRQRGAGMGGGHDEREQTLNQLLVEMDGFTHNQGVIVMAATNRADILDPALLRPGRFDRRIVVNYPDVKGREEILKVHSRGKPLAKDVDLKVLARRTPYFTGADLENVMNEAAILTARAGGREITMTTIEEAVTRVMSGPEKRSRKVTEKDRRLTAYHEGGHAVVSYYIPECDNVHEVTIIPRGQAGGYTMYLPGEETSYRTANYLSARIASAMGGRVAEQLVLGEISTGASSDIKQATEIARSMVTEYGMSAAVGPIFLGGRTGSVPRQELFAAANGLFRGSELRHRPRGASPHRRGLQARREHPHGTHGQTACSGRAAAGTRKARRRRVQGPSWRPAPCRKSPRPSRRRRRPSLRPPNPAKRPMARKRRRRRSRPGLRRSPPKRRTTPKCEPNVNHPSPRLPTRAFCCDYTKFNTGSRK